MSYFRRGVVNFGGGERRILGGGVVNVGGGERRVGERRTILKN